MYILKAIFKRMFWMLFGIILLVAFVFREDWMKKFRDGTLKENLRTIKDSMKKSYSKIKG